jgi:hypothetical protein
LNERSTKALPSFLGEIFGRFFRLIYGSFVNECEEDSFLLLSGKEAETEHCVANGKYAASLSLLLPRDASQYARLHTYRGR